MSWNSQSFATLRILMCEISHRRPFRAFTTNNRLWMYKMKGSTYLIIHLSKQPKVMNPRIHNLKRGVDHLRKFQHALTRMRGITLKVCVSIAITNMAAKTKL